MHQGQQTKGEVEFGLQPSFTKELLLPRQHYGIDFYGVHNGEILVMVDLFSRETILELLPQENGARVPDDYEANCLRTRRPG
jgi:hypothetical protein